MFYRKKIISITALLIFMGTLTLLAIMCGPKRLSYLSDEKYSEIKSAYTYSKTPLSLDLSFENQPLFYDDSTNTFYYSLIKSSETSYNPTIEAGDKVRLFAYGRPISDKLISGNILIKLIMVKDHEYSVSKLVCTTLPIMNIKFSKSIMKSKKLDDTYDVEEYTPCAIKLFDNGNDLEDEERQTQSFAKIHIRGGTTRGLPQKSYRLSLTEDKKDMDSKRKENLLGLRKDDDWILFAAYSDYEKIRTPFCMNLWNEMSEGNNEWKAPAANEYKYIELFFNNHYHGLYALTYPIDGKQFDLADDEALFKKRDWSGTEFSQELEYFEYEDGSGGYEYLPGYSLEDGDQEGYVELHNLYYQMAFSDKNSHIRNTCDIDNAIDLWLFYKLTQAVDNVYDSNVKNLYTAVKSADEDGKYKVLFAPWDMDQTFGNRFVDGQGKHGISSYYNTPDYDLPMAWSPVYFLMENDDSKIKKQVKDRYKELRSKLWSDKAIAKSIDEYETDIYDSGAFSRNKKRWADGNYLDESKGLKTFKKYVLKRLTYMDKYIKNL